MLEVRSEVWLVYGEVALSRESAKVGEECRQTSSSERTKALVSTSHSTLGEGHRGGLRELMEQTVR